MIEQLIDHMVDTDNMLVMKRTETFMNMLAQKSKEKFGIPIDPIAGHLFYVTGKPGDLSEAQQAFIRELAAECRAAYREIALDLLILTGVQKRGLSNTADSFDRLAS